MGDDPHKLLYEIDKLHFYTVGLVVAEKKPVKISSGGKPKQYDNLEFDLKFSNETTGEQRTLHGETPIAYHTTSTEKNPLKFSFGKVIFSQLTYEAYIYPLQSLDFVGGFAYSSFQKAPTFVFDKRRTKEYRALITKIGYFLGLSMKQKLGYVQKQGYFANINTTIIRKRASMYANKRGLDPEKILDEWMFNFNKYKEMLGIE